MPRLTKRRLHLASIVQAGSMAPKRPKLTPMEEDQAFLSEYEEDSDGQWEVDESRDSNVSSNSDDDEALSLLHQKSRCWQLISYRMPPLCPSTGTTTLITIYVAYGVMDL